MEKLIVFLSHITPEKSIAIEFKKLVEKTFLGLADVFVSSDEHNISKGQRWLDEITKALRNCKVEIILCSPAALQRPWINFEAGSGWIREIPVIPLCHTGMTPATLPVPLNMLQAASLTDKDELRKVFVVIAKALGASEPDVDFTEFVIMAKKFEAEYEIGIIETMAKLNDGHLKILKYIIEKSAASVVHHEGSNLALFEDCAKKGELYVLQVEKNKTIETVGIEASKAVAILDDLVSVGVVTTRIHGWGVGFTWYSLTQKGLSYAKYKGLFN